MRNYFSKRHFKRNIIMHPGMLSDCCLHVGSSVQVGKFKFGLLGKRNQVERS